MQIYEITLREAVPFMQVPDDPKYAKIQADLAKRQAQAQAQSDAALKALQATTNQSGQTSTASPSTTTSDAGSRAMAQMTQQLISNPGASSQPGTPPPPSEPPRAGSTTGSSAIANLDLRRDPNAPKAMPAKPSAMADVYAKKLQANPAQAAFAQRMAQLQKGQKTPAAAPPAPPQLTPITLGSGPNAQVFVNKGRGYVDQKTGAPMPPTIIKALGLQ